MKIIYVADVDFLSCKMNLQAYEKAMALGEREEVTIIKVRRGEQIDAMKVWEEYKPDIILQEHIQPKYPVMLTNLDKVPCETAMILGDCHPIPDTITENDIIDKIMKFKHILLMFSSEYIDNLKNKCPGVKFHRIKFHINTDVYKDYGLEKKYDVFVYGSKTPLYYPFRYRMTNLLAKSGLNVKILNEPKSYLISQDSTIVRGKELAKLINQSWLTLCTCSNVNYLVLKFFEIPACGSLPIGNLPPHDEEEFGKLMFRLDPNKTDDALINDIKELLKDKDRIKIMTQDYNYYVQRNYNMEQWKNKVIAWGNSILQ